MRRGPTWEQLEEFCKRNLIRFDRVRDDIERHEARRDAETLCEELETERAEVAKLQAEAEQLKAKWARDRDGWMARIESERAEIEARPYPWKMDDVERAADAYLGHVGSPVSSMRAALAVLAPPSQAAPVPPVGVGDVWGDAMRARNAKSPPP